MPPSGPQKDGLVQTTLTSRFSRKDNNEKTETKSPYFSKPASSAPKAKHDHTAQPSPSSTDQDTLLTKFKTLQTRTSSPSSKRSTTLAHTAAETKALLPTILKLISSAPPTGILYQPHDLRTLSQPNHPNLPGTPIRILNGDTLDTAISLSHHTPTSDQKPVCILNMANGTHGGGGWLRGALAQEETLCYRSSLSFTLKRRFYPLPVLSGIYSPSVVIIRQNLSSGHQLLDLKYPDDLPIVSVISVAAMRDPAVNADEKKYKRTEDRETMKAKMRIVLRIARGNGHRWLVLGALGCGAFNNPREEVVACWREVFGEAEFGGGCWDSVVFAVLDDGGKDGDGNFGIFWRGLEGLVV